MFTCSGLHTSSVNSVHKKLYTFSDSVSITFFWYMARYLLISCIRNLITLGAINSVLGFISIPLENVHSEIRHSTVEMSDFTEWTTNFHREEAISRLPIYSTIEILYSTEFLLSFYGIPLSFYSGFRILLPSTLKRFSLLVKSRFLPWISVHSDLSNWQWEMF